MAFPPAQKELYVVSNVKAETREHCSREKSEYLTCLKFNTTKDLSISYFKLVGRQSGVCCSSGDRAGALPRNYNGGSLSVKGFSEMPVNFQLHHFFSVLPFHLLSQYPSYLMQIQHAHTSWCLYISNVSGVLST